MSQIILGKSHGKNVSIDLRTFIPTRGLVTADSGGGKSWLLRRIIEQAFGKIQIVVIDYEGEFSSLREKLDFVIASAGGETPADVRSAALLAQRMLELRFSLIADIYEMKPHDRHEWVRLFLESMIDAPKKLWHPVLVIIDEAHVFCPEHGKGESSASEAMISLCTRGRKRGYTTLWASQRLATVNKDATSMLLNRMIGPTFEDVNRKRAADVLGVPEGKKERDPFYKEIQLLEPGNFHCLGRAITRERAMVHVGPVETTHPETGSAAKTYEPPPASQKIKALLPQLEDLPKTAEAKQRTEAEMKREIRDLKSQLRAAPAKTETKKVRVADPRAIEQAVNRAARDTAAKFKTNIAALESTIKRQSKTLADVAMLAAKAANVALPKIELPKIEVPTITVRAADGSVPPGTVDPIPPRTVASAHARVHAESNGRISAPQMRILAALAEFEALGRGEVAKATIAAMAGVSYTSGSYANNLGALRSAGYITYPRNDFAALTDDGRAIAPPAEAPPNSQDLLERCARVMSGPQAMILRFLHAKHPEAVSKDEIAEQTGVLPTSGSFANNLGALRTAGMIEYPSKGMARCSDWLFIE